MHPNGRALCGAGLRAPLALALLAGVVSLAAPDARAQLAPEAALAALRPADGLEVALFAAEPDVLNPTAMDIDAKGRVWVTEGVNYRIWKNPTESPAGDRIRVLEDTDGDGRCDKATTFWQDKSLQAPLGIAVVGDRVYVCQSPELFYLRDNDGDGVADEKTVILTGFGGVDHDHAIHGVMFGPDGALYMTNGDEGLDVTDASGNHVHVGKNAPHLAGSALRSDLDGKRLELLCEGLRNPYEPTVDSFGSVFISDNDDDGNEQCRIVHLFAGGDYGYWPRRAGDRRLDSVHWNMDVPGVIPMILKTGFGSPTGLLFYEGTLLPEKWRGSLIHADAGPRVIRSIPLARKGATYSATIDILLSAPEDSWFRPSDVCVAPDGSIFVADWYDPGVGGHNLRDWSRGHVYRLAPKGAPASAATRPSAVDVTTADGRAKALASPNLATRALAWQAFDASAAEAATAEEMENGTRELARLASSPDPILMARALWLLAPREGFKAALPAVVDPRPEFRELGVRLLARLGPDALKKAESLLKDRDAGVRRELILSLAKVDATAHPWVDEWLGKLAGAFDGSDRHEREALGIAMRGRESAWFARLLEADEGKWSPRFCELALQLHPPEALAAAGALLDDPSADEARRLAALGVVARAGGPEAGEFLLARLAQEGAPVARTVAVMELLGRDNASSWPKVRHDPRMDAFLKRALDDEALRGPARAMIVQVRIADAIAPLVAIAGDAARPTAERVEALDTVRALESRAAIEPLTGLVGDATPEVAAGAVRALAAMRRDDADDVLRATILDAAHPRETRHEAAAALGATRSGGLLLLRLAEEGTLPADLRLEVSRATNAAPFEDVRMMAEQLLPLEQSGTGEVVPPIAELVARKGDAARGEAVFFGETGPQCYKCHRVGDRGAEVGPNLDKIGEKLSRESIFESILEPSAAISHEYQVWIVRSRSKGHLTGYIRAEGPEGIDIVDATGATTRIKPDDEIERTKSATSLMPGGLSAGMTVQGLVDLAAWLEGRK